MFLKSGFTIEIMSDSSYNSDDLETLVDKQKKTESQLYSIVFNGELLPGITRDNAIASLARFYKVNGDQVAPLFSGKRFTLKENLSLDATRKLMENFEKVGIRCLAIKAGKMAIKKSPPTATSSPGPTPPGEKTPSPTPPVPPPTQSQPPSQPGHHPKPQSGPQPQHHTESEPGPEPEPIPGPLSESELEPAPEPEAGPEPGLKPIIQTPQSPPSSQSPQSPLTSDSVGKEVSNKKISDKEIYYQLVFQGELIQGRKSEEVKICLGKFYNVEPGRLDHFFTGRPVIVKELIDFWSATVYWKRFNDCGAICQFEAMEATGEIPPGNAKFKILFTGTIAPGIETSQAKARLSTLFRVPPPVIDLLFRGETVVIKANLTESEANLFKTNFEKTGANCQIVAITKMPPSADPKIAGPKIDQSYTGESPQAAPVKSTPMPGNKPVKEPGHPSSPPGPPVDLPEAFDIPETPTTPIQKIHPSKPVQDSDQSMQSSRVQARQFTFRQQKSKSKALLFIIVAVVLSGLALVIIPKFFSSSSEDLNEITQPSEAVTRKRARPIDQSQITPQPPPSDIFKLSDNQINFNDPKGHYYVTIPEGFISSDKSAGNYSKVKLQYEGGQEIEITAIPFQGEWNTNTEMQKKLATLQDSRVSILPGFQVSNFQEININGLDGFEIILIKSERIAHLIELASPQLRFSISFIASGKNCQELHDTLESAIKGTFSLF